MSKFDKVPAVDPPTYNCMNCKHSGPVQGGNVCRFKPPIPMIIPQQGLQGPVMSTVSLWPPVTNYDWCAEHTPKLQS